jgi:hypothetical protein
VIIDVEEKVGVASEVTKQDIGQKMVRNMGRYSEDGRGSDGVMTKYNMGDPALEVRRGVHRRIFADRLAAACGG